MQRFQEFLAATAEKYHEKTALENYRAKNAKQYSFDELYETSLCLAAYLYRKIGRNKHVAVISENCAEYIILFFAVQISGNVLIPLTDRYSDKEKNYILLNSDAEYLIYSEIFSDSVQEIRHSVSCLSMQELFRKNLEHISVLPETDSSALSMIVYSSGTGGTMKGIMLSQQSILYSTFGLSENCFTQGKTLLFLPLNHMYCWGGNVLLALWNGTEIQIISKIKTLFPALTEVNPECLFCVPMQLALFRNIIQNEMKKQAIIPCHHPDASKRREHYQKACQILGTNLHYLFTAGAPLDRTEAEFWHKIGISLVNIYGTTECSPFISSGSNEIYTENSIGKCISGCAYRLIPIEHTNSYHLLIKGKQLMLGYYKNLEETRKVLLDGWYMTGDAVEFHDKNLYIVGRIKNMIILSNGENISPEELESAVSHISSVKEVIVYAEQDTLCAKIRSDSKETETQIRKELALLNADLPEYKRIRNVIISHEPLPRTALDKIKRI